MNCVGIPEADLDRILTQRNDQTASGLGLYELAKEKQDQWRRMVEYLGSDGDLGSDKDNLSKEDRAGLTGPPSAA